MIQKSLNDITKEDLQSLIDNEVLESKTLDYKQGISLNTDNDKREFLADITAFANTSGGDIIYGIKETDGLPCQVLGLDITKEEIDSKTLQMENLIRDGVEPRVPNIQIKFVELEDLKYVLIIRIGKSWMSPHWVSLKGYKRFYARGNNSNYQLDIEQLRNAFILSESLANNIKQFRAERLSKIIGDETPVLMEKGAKIIVHLIPLSAFSISAHLDIKMLKKNALNVHPLYSSGWDYRINFDGFLLYSSNNDGSSYSYTQFYRNGIIEMVNSNILKSWANDDKYIPSQAYEYEIIKTLEQCINYYKNIDINTPIFGFISLVGVKGYWMATSNMWGRATKTIDRDILLTPESVIDNFDDNIEHMLKPCFDSIWNACGYESSLNYDAEGKWKHGQILKN